MATTSVEPVGDPAGRLDHATKTRIFTTLVVIVVFTEVAPLQYTMISAALQKIAPSFPAEGANINWSIIVFGLVGAAASPLLGKMSDVWGKKRMFLVCGALFARRRNSARPAEISARVVMFRNAVDSHQHGRTHDRSESWRRQ